MTTDLIVASTLIDAGDAARDNSAVVEGEALLERLLIENPNDPDILYPLANALTARSAPYSYKSPDWYLQTLELRVRARVMLHTVGRSEGRDDIRARAITNLGNALWTGHRWVEAYDTYLQALAVDPSNAVARTGAVKALLRQIKLGLGDNKTLRAVASEHLKRAGEDRNRLIELAGTAAAEELNLLLQKDLTGGEYPDLSQVTPYEQFVARERLALTPTIEGIQPGLRRWDTLRLESIVEPLDREHGVPPVFAMFNVLKSDYLAARWQCYTALHEGAPESGSYADTLDYARYGINVSLLILTQRAAMDVFDKIAVFVAEYLETNEKPRTIWFRNRWYEKDKSTGSLTWNPFVEPEISRGNPGFIALAEVASDLNADGYLYSKKASRNTGTHRFSVIHDLQTDPSRPSAYATHYGEEEFQVTLLDTLRLTRSALIYLAEAVGRREAHLANGKRLGTLTVPSHDWIRGRDQDDLPTT
ncbi:MAG: hypothetical protein GTO51_00600 [Candidatus Latescibacteria bacterium]|nr:hypothetical protein [Candidatus Latescibacterota bacterium]NIM64481.1 hypothetical protein [Candidatus Latescibacterota bacterium]NIO00634.1 hypothetical protein [Candidatus Latescibacterota bacterium]NIO27037.1 hypothetical protein [Candidatus Latescibacterota bacterium]NIO54561.1 hypothetical protein [Candidatus Latescibacterota bacterium]